jgi:hypothetical protein
MLALFGLMLVTASLVGLWIYVRLVNFVVASAEDSSIAWDYLPLGIAILCALVAGYSLFRSALSGRTRDMIPGPTLYLLGACIMIIAVQAWLASGSAVFLAGVLLGLALMVLEYRLDVL